MAGQAASKRPSSIRSRNARPSTFPRVRPEVEEPKAMLPINREVMPDAEFHFSEGGLSISARIVKSRTRRVCEDTAIIFVENGITVAGVFDGYGGNLLFSEKAAETVLKACSKQIESGAVPDPKQLLIDAMDNVAGMSGVSNSSGGAIATIAVVSPDWTYKIASTADSAVFEVGKRVRRLLEYDYYTRLPWFSDNYEAVREKASGTSLETYAEGRYMVCMSDTINASRTLSEDRIEVVHGEIRKNGLLLLVTEGIIKNLSIELDSNRVVSDISGCSDIQKMLGTYRDPEFAVKIITEEVLCRSSAKNTRVHGQTAHIPAEEDSTVIAIRRDQK